MKTKDALERISFAAVRPGTKIIKEDGYVPVEAVAENSLSITQARSLYKELHSVLPLHRDTDDLEYEDYQLLKRQLWKFYSQIVRCINSRKKLIEMHFCFSDCEAELTSQMIECLQEGTRSEACVAMH